MFCIIPPVGVKYSIEPYLIKLYISSMSPTPAICLIAESNSLTRVWATGSALFCALRVSSIVLLVASIFNLSYSTLRDILNSSIFLFLNSLILSVASLPTRPSKKFLNP